MRFLTFLLLLGCGSGIHGWPFDGEAVIWSVIGVCTASHTVIPESLGEWIVIDLQLSNLQIKKLKINKYKKNKGLKKDHLGKTTLSSLVT